MKKLVFGFATLVAVAATSFAGTETYSQPAASKEYKQVETPSCFSDREIQLDLAGAYQVGNGSKHAGPINNHGWGGSAAVNYFFMRYFGLSAEGDWVNAEGNSLRGGHGNRAGHHGTSVYSSAVGNLIFRYPIDRLCIAPYAFIGGGGTFNGGSWGLGDVGVGLEYRVVPNKVGIFADGRWNYYGDRQGHDVQNNFLIRSGVRLVF